jgi:hypothetical protein
MLRVKVFIVIMKNFIFILLFSLSFSEIKSQDSFGLFLIKEYPESFSGDNRLHKTDQTYSINLNNDTLRIHNSALSLVSQNNETCVYYNGEFEDCYETEVFSNSNHFVIHFKLVNTYYFVFKLYDF